MVPSGKSLPREQIFALDFYRFDRFRTKWKYTTLLWQHIHASALEQPILLHGQCQRDNHPFFSHLYFYIAGRLPYHKAMMIGMH